MRFSVVIATRDRGEIALRAARSALAQDWPAGRFEVIVVDNGSSDGTAEAMRSLAEEHSAARMLVLEEPAAGASRARNAGVAAASGDYVAFLDDDAIAPPDWLSCSAKCLDVLDPKPAALGGPIEPHYDCPKPAWFEDRYERRSHGAEARELGSVEVLSGSNMIWDRETLLRIGGFDVSLGPSGAKFGTAEDTELCLRLRRLVSDAVIWYAPELQVLHSVTERSFSTRRALARGYKEGVGWQAAYPPRRPWGMLVELLRRLGILAYLAAASLASFQWLYRPKNWCFENGRRMFVQAGNIAGLLRGR